MSRVGVPSNADGWRCPVCTLVNSMDVEEACPRCKEPVDEARKLKLRVRTQAPGAPSCAMTSTAASSKGKSMYLTKSKASGSAIGSGRGAHKRSPRAVAKRLSQAKNSALPPAKPQPRNTNPKPAAQIHSLKISKSKSKLQQQKNQQPIRNNSSGAENKRLSQSGSKRASSSTFGAGRQSMSRTSSVTKPPVPRRSTGTGLSTAKRTTQPSKWTQQQKQMSEKHLGYKTSKSNVAKMVKSKLNHDTAAYRGKFEQPESKKGSNIATISDLTSKQGFQTSISRGKVVQKKKNLHDDKIVRPPPSKRDNKGPSVIARLQMACSGEVMGSLRHTGTRHELAHKNIAGQKSKLML